MTHLRNVEFICGNENICNEPLKIFSDEAFAFLNELSSEIFSSKDAKAFPELASFAFWCRRANITKLKQQYVNNEFNIGRGVCFHITPSNIPINFAYSYAFSLISGNSNIVKLPSKFYPQIDIICALFNKVLKNHPEIFKRTVFVKYPRESSATNYFSQLADCRMIWGGDQTISQIKKIDAKPRVVDILFADRYSFSIFNAEAMLTLEESQLKTLCENFYNDTLLMDQNACSSPQLICWVNDNEAARRRFWDMSYSVAKEKYDFQESKAIDKYTKLCEDSINLSSITHFTKNENLIYRIELSEISSNLETLRGKFGYFYEHSLREYSEIFKIINSKYQTLTYFGIDSKELVQELIKNNARGIDRIVPVGKALDIDIHWDGHDLVRELSREIVQY